MLFTLLFCTRNRQISSYQDIIMKQMFENFYVCFFILHLFLTQVSCDTHNEQEIPEPKLLQYSNGGIKLIIKDIDHVFNYVELTGDLTCDDTSHPIFLKKSLEYNEINKEWIYENLQINFCSSGYLNYKIFAIQNSIRKDLEGSIRIAVQQPKSTVRKQKDNGLLGGVTTGLLGGVNLDLLGLQVSNNDQNKQKQPQQQHTFSNNYENLSTQPNSKVKCESSKTTINNNRKICKGELIFEDNFNEMNWTKWNRDIKLTLDSEDADFVSFQNFNENLYIQNGNLYIVPKISNLDENEIRTGSLDLGNNCTGIIDRNLECKRNAFLFRILPPVVSARITTKNKFSFKYGVIEIKAKLPKGDWLFPQLFLEPATNNYGITGYSSGQIRLAFIRGNEILDSKEGRQIDGFRLYGGVVLSQGENFRETWMKDTLKRRNHFGDDYHIYKTIWTDEYISFEVDGVEYGRLNGNFSYEAFDLNKIEHAKFWKTGDKMAPFDQEFFLSFGVSAGGISDFPDNSSSSKREIDQKPWENFDSKNELNFWKAKERWYSTWIGENAALKVDYVRVWAL